VQKIKVLILVLSINDNGGIYDKFKKTQIETWDSITVDGVKTFYYYGNSNENKIIDNNIHVTIPEDYWNCGNRTIEALKIINQKFDYDFLYRTNSSSYVDKEMLIQHLNSASKNRYYAGHYGNDNGVVYSSGSGIMLSKDLVNLILENGLSNMYIDDVDIGYLMSSHGVYPENILRCHHDYGENVLSCDGILYRLKTEDREWDRLQMYQIHKLKLNKKNQ
jgi:hypothetical protein